MPGAGKYDGFCSAWRELIQASGLLVVVIDGCAGSGISLQTEAKDMPGIASLLRRLANEIEKDYSTKPVTVNHAN